MTYQNDHANRQTAHGLRPLRVLVSKWISALLFYAARAGGWLGQPLCKSLCFYAARADLAKQRRQLAEMTQWQLRDIGIDPIAAEAEAERSSWGAESPWQNCRPHNVQRDQRRNSIPKLGVSKAGFRFSTY